MSNRKVTLLKYVKTEKGWRRLHVAIAKNGRVRPHYVIVDGVDEFHPEGHYELKYYDGGKAVYRAVGEDPAEGLAIRDQQARLLVAQTAAKAAGIPIEENSTRMNLAQARDAFMQRLRLKNRDKETISAYGYLIAEFLRLSAKCYPEEITDIDLLRFCQSQRERGLAERTVYNHFAHIRAFLRSCGVDVKKLIPEKKDLPQKNDPLPEAYTQEEVEKFLAACNSARDRMVFEFFLKTGVREKELAYAEWSDIRWTEGVLLVQNKPHYDFHTKTGKPRKITLEAVLLEKLAAWRRCRPNTRFVFGTKTDKPNGHFLEACKRTAHRAGLNCGHCAPCLEKDECERWYLHKFRATFATWSLRGGVDLRTVQLALGHTKIEMTERYLAPAEGPAAQAKMNAVFAGLNTGQQPNVAIAADSARLSPSRLAVRRQEALPEEAAGVAASVGD